MQPTLSKDSSLELLNLKLTGSATLGNGLFNIQEVNHPELIGTSLAGGTANFSFYERSESPYADILKYVPEHKTIEVRHQFYEDFDNIPYKEHLEERLNTFGFIPEKFLADLYDDLIANHSLACRLMETTDLVCFTRVLDCNSSSDPKNFSRWHIDSGVILNLIWTPASDYSHATEVTNDANISRQRLLEAWSDLNYPKLIDDEDFMIKNKENVFKLKNNSLGLILSELLTDDFYFNHENGCIHRGIPLMPGQRRLVNSFMATNIPSYLHNRIIPR